MLYLTSSTAEKNTSHFQNKFSSVNESGQLIETHETHFGLVPLCKAGQVYVNVGHIN